MPKRGCLGCSFPVIIGVAVIVLALLVVSLLGGPVGSKLLGLIGIHFELPAWASVLKPEPKLPAEAILHVGGFLITNTMIAAWITTIVLVVVSILATRRMKLVPAGLQALLEFVLELLLNFCNSVAGEKNGRKFFPVVATIFLFVIVNACLSLIPGYGSIVVIEAGHKMVPLLRGANTDLNVPLVLALFSFVAVEYFGIRTLKLRYLKKFINVSKLGSGVKMLFMGKVKSAFAEIFFGIIDVAVGLLEALSEFIRIVSFTFRLFGNMTAGEILLLIAAFLVPWVFPVIFYGLELLVGLIQAVVFGGLTLVFLTMAVASHDEHSEKH